jgi:SAM-dependent methyltransferase
VRRGEPWQRRGEPWQRRSTLFAAEQAVSRAGETRRGRGFARRGELERGPEANRPRILAAGVPSAVPSDAPAYLQRDQPPGVPPLALTGERTLPDIPEENYWFRRHLAVYEWIARRVRALRVIDMACGEGYGAYVLASCAASVIGVDANPEAYEHARLRYKRANLRFERDLIERFGEPAEAVVCLQTIEHVHDADALLAHFRSLVVGGGGAVYVSTPNVLTLAPKGAVRSDNPWHVREYRAQELRALCERHFSSVALLGVYHARKLRAHELALRLGWDRAHAALGITERFYGAFTPSITSRDFALRAHARGRDRGRRGGAGRLDRALDLVAVCRA